MFTKVHADRLLRLAAFLDDVPPHRFDYSRWVGTDWKGKEDLSCGTTACALGWATTMPEFRRLGLRLGLDMGTGVVHLKTQRPNFWSSPIYASEKVFGLTYKEHGYLFGAAEGPSGERSLAEGARATTVAKHIRRFVKRKLRAASLNTCDSGGVK